MKLQSVFLAALASFGLANAVPASAQISDQDFSAAMDKYLSGAGAEKVANALEAHFRKKQQEAAEQQRKSAEQEMEEQFKNPVKIDPGSSPVKGPAGAKVTVIEFSDFQCPFCKRGKDTMDELLKAYPNDVKLVFKNLPLDFHQQAKPAAAAALAAGKQGKFWEMHDLLFENQGRLGDGLYEELAKELKLDVAKFKTDLKSPEIEKQIESDMSIARNNGIQGTPAFFVNGVAVRGAYPLDHFKKIVDRHLGKAQQ